MHGLGFGQFNRQRIAVNAIDTKLVVQMRPGSKTRTADVANYLALLDFCAVAHATCIAVQMTIGRGVASAVTNHNQATVSTFIAGKDNLAIARCPNRCASRRGIVNTFVRTPFGQYRVPAFVGKA